MPGLDCLPGPDSSKQSRQPVEQRIFPLRQMPGWAQAPVIRGLALNETGKARTTMNLSGSWRKVVSIGNRVEPDRLGTPVNSDITQRLRLARLTQQISLAGTNPNKSSAS
jgi:hypothetical protein